MGLIDNFRKAAFVRGGCHKVKRNFLSIDRGYEGEFEALILAIKQGGLPPVPFEEYVKTTMTTFAIEQSLAKGKPMGVFFDMNKR